MRIAQVAPIIESVPPEKYGGTERVVHALTEELVRMGHDVTLFASGDSQTSAKLVSVYPKALRTVKLKNLYGANSWSLLNIGLAYKMQDQFDIIHDHNNYLSLPAANISTTPVILTIHGAFNPSVKDIFEQLNNVNIVTISKSQSQPLPNLNYIGNVYHGLDMEDYPFSDQDEGYLLFVGRISIEKGVHHIIDVSQRLNLPLIIAAKLNSWKTDMQYFEEYIEPHLNDKIRWVGEVTESERNKLMSKALCFLNPVTWREPFGLTVIEAMACGCPVIAFSNGSMPEIIKDGKTGFLVEDVRGMVKAVKKINKIDRSYCRKFALRKFSAKKMAQQYVEIYKKIIQHKKTTNQTYQSSHTEAIL